MYVLESLVGVNALKFAAVVVTVLALFTFLSIVIFMAQRRKERDTYYRFELRKKALEQGAPAETLIQLQRQEDQLRQRRRREGQRLGGLITTGAGLGMLGVVFAEKDLETLGVAAIPIFIGLALFAYAQWMAPKGIDPDRQGGPGRGGDSPGN
jgi:hypothetical protein